MLFSNYLQRNEWWKWRGERRGRRGRMGERKKRTAGDVMAVRSSPTFLPTPASWHAVAAGPWMSWWLTVSWPLCPLSSLTDDCPGFLSIAAAEGLHQHCLLPCRDFLSLLESCSLQKHQGQGWKRLKDKVK